MKTFTPFEYLLIDVANQYGLDKKLYEQRIDWAQENLDKLETLVDEAETPNMYWKAVDAVRCAQGGIPTGHLVGFDSAASGIQLLSVCSRCVVGMMNTGVLNDDTRTGAPDIYTTATKVMNRESYVRKAIKNALMVYFYGSDAQPIATFGEGEDLQLFFNAAKQVAPEAFDLRSILVGMWNPEAEAHTWVMPDHGVVYKRVWDTEDYRIQEPLLGSSFTFRTSVNRPIEKGVSLAADVTHSIDAYLLRELNRRCNFDRETLRNALELINAMGDVHVTDRSKIVSLVEVDYLNEDTIQNYSLNQLAILKENITLSLNAGSFEVVNVHDEFKVHPLYVNQLRKHYNKILQEFYYSNLLADIIQQISGLTLQVNEVNESVADKILDADYPIN